MRRQQYNDTGRPKTRIIEECRSCAGQSEEKQAKPNSSRNALMTAETALSNLIGGMREHLELCTASIINFIGV